MNFRLSVFKLIAIFEAVKGLAVLIAGLGILEYLHRHLQDVGEILLRHAGFRHLPEEIIKAFENLNDAKLLWIAAGVVAYCVVRLLEAYGLWFERNWARWLGVISGGIYLPYEFYELAKHFSWLKLAITVGNILVVAYLLKHRPHPARQVPAKRG